MGQAPHKLWLKPEQESLPAGGCSGCVDTPAGPACRVGAAGEACLAPELSGDATVLARLLAALNAEVREAHSGRGIVELHWVKSLRVSGSEAELEVTFPPSCGGGKLLAEDAFVTLKRLLPDTDVYVFHC